MNNVHVCAICGRMAFCCHFKAMSCNACAAFFRRTVAEKKVFTCENYGNCAIDPWQNPKLCPACRFRRCISVGMQESKVLSHGPSRKSKKQTNEMKHQIQQSSVAVDFCRSALMPKLQKFDYSSNFSPYQNHEWLRKLLLANQLIGHQRTEILKTESSPFCKKSFVPDITKYIPNELRFCQTYLGATGILEIAQDVINENISNFVFKWIYLTMVLNTLQYDSIQIRKMTLVDCSMVEMSEAAIREMYASEPSFHKHLDTFVNTAIPGWYRTEELMIEIRALGMTKEEQACFALFFIIETITRLSSEPQITRSRFKPLLDSSFRSMHVYYRDNFSNDCIGIRLGELVMALPYVNEINNIFDEHRRIVFLCNGELENFTPPSLLRTFYSHLSVKNNNTKN